MGAHMCALSEGMALAEKCDLDQVTLLELWFQHTFFVCIKNFIVYLFFCSILLLKCMLKFDDRFYHSARCVRR